MSQATDQLNLLFTLRKVWILMTSGIKDLEIGVTKKKMSQAQPENSLRFKFSSLPVINNYSEPS